MLNPQKRKRQLNYYSNERVGEDVRHALQHAFAEIAIDQAFWHPELLEITQDLIRNDKWVEHASLYEQFEAAVPGSKEKIGARATELAMNRPDRTVF